jgi:hypothetical protein
MTSVTVAHAWLLRAALLPADAARDAWRSWTAATDVNALDEASTWLLPQLYQNLSTRGVATPAELTRYENVFRHNWYKNNLRLHQARPRINAISRTGRTPLLTGPSALAVAYYDQLAARPFDEVTLNTAADGDVRTIAWKDLQLRVPGPAAMLEAVTARQDSWDRRSHLLWIVDAAMIVRRHPDLTPGTGGMAKAIDGLRSLGVLP